MSCEYHFGADALNKFSQITPWIQAVVSLVICTTVLGLARFIKEMVVAIVSAFSGKDKAKPPMPETRK